MLRTLLVVSTALVLSACGGNGPNTQAAIDTANLRAQVAQDLAPAYDDIAAFCLGLAEGRGANSALLTTNGFTRFGNKYERTWAQGKINTGLQVRARHRSPQGCSVDIRYDPSFSIASLESTAPLRAAWTTYLTAQGYTVGEPENSTFTIKTKDGQSILDFDIGGTSSTLLAVRDGRRLKISSYSNDTRTTEYMQTWE